jgi:hypothetical protein
MKFKIANLLIVVFALGMTASSQTRMQVASGHSLQAQSTTRNVAVPRVAEAGATLEPFALLAAPFDPGHTGTVVAQWIRHLGLQDPNETDTANFGLLLTKDTATATNAAGVAQVAKNQLHFPRTLNIMNLTELGYDINNATFVTACTAGSPRFDVIDTNGNLYFVGGCAHGAFVSTPAPGWVRVRFDPTNPGQAFPPIPPGTVISKIFLIADDGTDATNIFGAPPSGIYILDNIEIAINGSPILIGEPN